MSKDYSKSNHSSSRASGKKSSVKKNRVKPSRKPIASIIWLFGGILIGTLATGLYYNSDDNPSLETQPSNDETTTPNQEKTHTPRFDFYTLLKESEVIVPEDGNINAAVEPVTVPDITEIKSEKNSANSALKSTVINRSAPKESYVVSTPSKKTTARKPSVAPKATTINKAAKTTSPTERTVYMLQAGSFKKRHDADSVRANLVLLNMNAKIEVITAANNVTWYRVLVGPFNDKSTLSQARSSLTRNGIDSIQLKRRL